MNATKVEQCDKTKANDNELDPSSFTTLPQSSEMSDTTISLIEVIRKASTADKNTQCCQEQPESAILDINDEFSSIQFEKCATSTERAHNVSPDGSRSNPGRWKQAFRYALYTIVTIFYLIYFGFALALNFRNAIPLLALTSLATVVLISKVVRSWLSRSDLLGHHHHHHHRHHDHHRQQRQQHRHQTLQHPQNECRENNEGATKVKTCCQNRARLTEGFETILGQKKIKIACYLLVIVAACSYLIVQHSYRFDRLRPVAGMAAIVLLSWIISYNRAQIFWRPVIWGLVLQMCLGLVTLRTAFGRESFRFLGRQMEQFLTHVDAGVLFVFGEKYQDFFFIFKLMPTVIFLSSVLAILYHIGLMQRVVEIMARAMAITMATTAAESTSTVACIFLGQPEASLTIKPFLPLMTRSELFSITTAGFASVTADVFAIFVHYGMPSAHIITAVLMSAPASIAVSKIICPETEISQTKDRKQLRIYAKQRPRYRSLLDAAVQGAQDAAKIILSIVVTIISFLSILSFLNAVINYLGELVNIGDLSLEKLTAYPLIPVAYLLGVDWEDCYPIAEVIGLKTFVNELVGYQRLDEIVKRGGIKHKGSHVIAMYALCGFSNPTTIGITLGGLSAMVPQKREVLVNIIIMSWLAGCLACFMTAAWAGLLHTEEDMRMFNETTQSG